jgi:hypothetical protein
MSDIALTGWFNAHRPGPDQLPRPFGLHPALFSHPPPPPTPLPVPPPLSPFPLPCPSPASGGGDRAGRRCLCQECAHQPPWEPPNATAGAGRSRLHRHPHRLQHSKICVWQNPALTQPFSAQAMKPAFVRKPRHTFRERG